MPEHMPNTAEHGEHQAEALDALRQEQLEKLSRSGETNETDPASRIEAARDTLRHQEVAPEPAPAAETEHQAAGRTHTRFQLDHRHTYKQTLASLQRQLSPVSRSFSKVIHLPAIEKTSEALEKTIARPSSTLGATWTALLVGGIFYFVARAYGYPLSGSELLYSFLVGAVLGLIIEGLARLAKRRP